MAPATLRLATLAEDEIAAHRRQPRPRAPRLWPWVAGALLAACGAASAILLEHANRPDLRAPAAGPAGLLAAGAAIAATIALFFAARAALAPPRGGTAWHTGDGPR